jgi:hypothetical protein
MHETSLVCTSCVNWQLKTSPLARHGFAACALMPRWTHYPDRHGCASHKPAPAEVTEKRAAWLNKKGG